MFERVKDKPLPDWADELGIYSWGQYFLKWIVGAPGGHLRDPGDFTRAAHAGQLPRRVWRDAGREAARTHGGGLVAAIFSR